MDLGTKLPPQFGQTLPKRVSTHVAQNVHSYVQMRASSESGGKGLLQCSQVGLSSSTIFPPCRLGLDIVTYRPVCYSHDRETARHHARPTIPSAPCAR